MSDDATLQLDGVINLRKATSVEINPPTACVIESGLLTRLVELLQKSDNNTLLLEVLW